MTFEEHVDLLRGVGYDSSRLCQSYNNLLGLNNPFGVAEADTRNQQARLQQQLGRTLSPDLESQLRGQRIDQNGLDRMLQDLPKPPSWGPNLAGTSTRGIKDPTFAEIDREVRRKRSLGLESLDRELEIPYYDEILDGKEQRKPKPRKFRTGFWERETKPQRCRRFFLFILRKLFSGVAWGLFWWICLLTHSRYF